MTFRKVAAVTHLGSFEVDQAGKLKKQAQLTNEAAQRSYYMDGSAKVDVRGVLKRRAADYAISDNPSDYLFEVIRANTTSVFNDNHDGFSRDELLRFDPRLRTAVYLTYREKPHHVNHRTDNPKRARGIILDAHYNAESTPLSSCPGCGAETKKRANRDASNINCKRCGTVVNDEFVEILVAVDKKKDPAFARAVQSGQLRFGSMGCTCSETVCNVCNNVARTRAEFCKHIASHKGSYWAKAASDKEWSRINPRTAQAEMARRGRTFHERDFVSLKAEDGYEIRKAAEWCQGVEYDEYSRVHMPADPKAERIELLSKAASASDPSTDDLSAETARLVAAATARKGRRRTAAQEKTAMKFHLVRVDGDPLDTYAAESLDQALEMANPDAGSTVEVATVEAPDAGAARLMADTADFEPHMGAEGDVVINIEEGSDGESISTEPLFDEDEDESEDEGEDSIEDFTDEMLEPEEGPVDEEFSPEELGVMPAGASKEARVKRSSYSDWKVTVTDRGTAQVHSPKGPVLLVAPSKRLATRQARTAFGREVLNHLQSRGLFHTVKAYNATYHRKFSSVVDHALDDMKDFSDKDTKSDVASDGGHDMRSVERGTHAKDSGDEAAHDMKMSRDKKPSKSTEEGMADHEIGHDARPDNASENEGSDMREPRKPFSVAKDDALADPAFDHSRKAARPGDYEGQLEEYLETYCGDCETVEEAKAEIHQDKEMVEMLDEWDPDPEHLNRLIADFIGEEDDFPVEMGKFMANKKTRAVVKVASFDDKRQTFTVVDRKLNTSQISKADLKRQWQQIDNAPTSYEENLKRWAKAEIAKARKEATASVFRALRLAAQRAHKGLEESPLKVAMAMQLANDKVVGHDGYTQQPLEYRGMSDELSIHLVEAAFADASEREIDTLLNRAAKLLQHDTNYLKSAERDLQKQAHRVPPVTAASMVDEVSREAETLRRSASAGNLELAPQPSEERSTRVAAQSSDDRAGAIRSALGGTRVGARIQLRQ